MADVVLQQDRCELQLEDLLLWYGVKKSTFYDWQKEPTMDAEKPPFVSAASVRPDEIAAVLAYRDLYPDIGYRKFTWQMVDANVAFLSESKVYDILSAHNRLQGWNKVDNGETGKEYRHKPRYVHYHWHTDIAYIKVGGIFYFLIMMLDGYSRYLLDWELMTDMLGGSVENFVQRVKEKYPHARPRLINDNGSQFISHDFKRLLQKLEIQQIFTRRNHPQTNGKIERMNGTVKQEALRPGQPCDFSEAWEILNKYSYEYNHQRLHAGINFLRPADMFFGRGGQVLNERREKIENARADRKSLNREERMKNLH
ncbi:DDE-type integrase/transposase/recombinase [bacterium]|nr:DDE-type integrase/transposase/recombinase [bacterium]